MTDTALRAGAQSANNTHMVFVNEELKSEEKGERKSRFLGALQ